MERITTPGGDLTADSNRTNPLSAKVEGAVQAVHKTTDRIADKTATQVDLSADAVHRAVDSVADAATSAAQWASTVPEQAKHVQTRLAESAGASIREHPVATVAGALAVGYLLGRLARR